MNSIEWCREQQYENSRSRSPAFRKSRATFPLQARFVSARLLRTQGDTACRGCVAKQQEAHVCAFNFQRTSGSKKFFPEASCACGTLPLRGIATRELRLEVNVIFLSQNFLSGAFRKSRIIDRKISRPKDFANITTEVENSALSVSPHSHDVPLR